MKPEPKTIKVVCTACGLDWEAHGAKPTLAQCVELLKAELGRASARASRLGSWPAQSWAVPSQAWAVTAANPMQLPRPAGPPRIDPEAKAS